MTQACKLTEACKLALKFASSENKKEKENKKDTNTDSFGICAQEPLHLFFHIRRLDVL